MATIVERAAKGHKKSMEVLFETYKDSLYGFCTMVLKDQQKAKAVVTSAFRDVWKKLSSQTITSEHAFKQLLFTQGAKYCKEQLFPKNQKTDWVQKAVPVETPTFESFEYTKNVENGLQELQQLLETVAPHERFIYYLHTAGELSFETIGMVLQQRPAVVKYHYQMTLVHIAGVLQQKEETLLNMQQLSSLVTKACQNQPVPKSVVAACQKQIAGASKSQWDVKVVLGSVLGSICVIGIIVLVIVAMKDAGNTDTTTSQTGSQTYSSPQQQTSTLYTPPALEEDVTYFADIEIKNYGTITVQLNQKEAPITAANFVELANKGFYNGLTFHRIIEGFMMQGGCPEGNGTGGNTDKNGMELNIKGEFAVNGHQNNISHKRGTISMARNGYSYDSGSSQFFIMHEDNTGLDGQYASFGTVTKGMDVVDKVCGTAKPIDGNGSIAKDAQPVITSITIRTK